MRQRLLAALLRLAGSGGDPQSARGPGRIVVIALGVAGAGAVAFVALVLVWATNPWLIRVVCDYLGFPQPT